MEEGGGQGGEKVGGGKGALAPPPLPPCGGEGREGGAFWGSEKGVRRGGAVRVTRVHRRYGEILVRRATDVVSLQRLGGETVSAAERRLRHGGGGQPTGRAMRTPRYNGFRKFVPKRTSR